MTIIIGIIWSGVVLVNLAGGNYSAAFNALAAGFAWVMLIREVSK